MHPRFFRWDLTESEQQDFKDHARANYIVGEPIDPEGIRHPLWVFEAALMNLEAWQEYRIARFKEEES